MRAKHGWGKCLAGLLAAVTLLALGGCAVELAQARPPDEKPFGEVEHEDRGEVVSVVDTKIDLRTGQGRVLGTTQSVGVGPIGVGVPITLGGESKREVPGEDITVKLKSGKLVHIVQQLSSPPYGVGEAVKVQYEKPNRITGEARTRVVRGEY